MERQQPKLTNEQLNKLEQEVKESFVIAQNNVRENCKSSNRAEILKLISEIVLNSLRMINEMRDNNEQL